MFVVVCIGLGYLGSKPPEGIYVYAGRLLTVCYFAYFLVILPLLSRIETPRAVPNSIADAVLAKSGKVAASVVAMIVAGGLLVGGAGQARAEEAEAPPAQKWSFSGPFGTYDRGSLQRGLKIYKEVCSNCHSLNYIAFRNIADHGGPGYSEAQAAGLAAEYKIKDGPNDQGEMFERPGRPADYFPAPFPNEQAARAANGGGLPPDLSLIAKARGYERGFPRFIFDFFTQYQEQGPDYVAAILQGFEDKPPAGVYPSRRLLLQQVFPRPRHQDAAAAVSVRVNAGRPSNHCAHGRCGSTTSSMPSSRNRSEPRKSSRLGAICCGSIRTPCLRRRAIALLTPSGSADRAAVVASHRDVLTMPGDVQRGAAVFRSACASCHRLDEIGHDVGPNLRSALGNKTAKRS